ncbi:MAG TPA: hypothetical protein DGG94_05170 [Micromonosporaceae bacterium]|nr:hypothetical protein [Micromonosporaceae bacterium]HCU49190.1 hypothetical protein [Micromonosporaceae bacterium]
MESSNEILSGARWADMKIGNAAIKLKNPDDVRFEAYRRPCDLDRRSGRVGRHGHPPAQGDP